MCWKSCSFICVAPLFKVCLSSELAVVPATIHSLDTRERNNTETGGIRGRANAAPGANRLIKPWE